MKKLKQRFKRALFAFFKDEILTHVGYQHPMKTVEIKHEYLNVTEIRSDIVLGNNRTTFDYSPFEYQEAVKRAKEQLFKECMKYVVVDTVSLMNPEIYHKTAIKVSLFIGRK